MVHHVITEQCYDKMYYFQILRNDVTFEMLLHRVI